ncbi:MAG: glycosyltransferase [Pseudomonadota bacterium]
MAHSEAPLRVLVLASTFPRWSGDRQPAFIRDFCRHLPDCEVHVLAPGAAGAAAGENLDGVQVHRFRYAPLARWQTLAYGGGMLANVRENPLRLLLLPPYLAAMLFAAWRLAIRHRIRIVHAHWIIPQGVVGALLRWLLPRTRLVVTAHGGDAYAFHGRIGRRLKRLVLRRADAVTAVSTHLRNDLQRDLAPLRRPPAIAPMGIDLARFAVPATIRRRRFCFVGRLVEKKGVNDLLLAYAQARARMTNDFPDLLLVGDGPLRDAVATTIRRLDLTAHVTQAGWIDAAQVPQVMAESLAVVVPSIVARDGDREGLGLVAVEALAAGTPVIAYDYGAIRDVVVPGTHGLLAPQGDIEALAGLLAGAAGGSLPVIDDRVRADIRARFDWQAVTAGYRALYRRLD